MPIRTPSLWLLAWVAGVGLQMQQPALWPGHTYLVLGAACVALAGVAAWPLGAAGGTRRGGLWIGVLAMSGIAFAMTGVRADLRQAERLAPALENRPLWIEAMLAEMPDYTTDGALLVVRPQAAAIHDEPAPPPRLRLFWPGAPPGLAAGQVWGWTVTLRAPHGTANPHGFDRELWLWSQGVGATGWVRQGRADRAPQPLGDTWAHPVQRLRGRLAASVAQQVADPRLAGVIVALLVGHQSAILPADWRLFRDTGIAHLMAISGLHITLFAWLAQALLSRLWRVSARQWPTVLVRWPAPHVAAWGGLALAAAYALLAGWGVPAQRTVFMLACVVLLRWRGLDWPWPVTWLAVLALVLTLDPWAGLQAGFWLSFVAVMLLFAGDRQRNDSAGAGASPQAGLSRLVVALGRLWREQWVMSLALAPLVLLWFGQVSVVGLLANLMAIPWVTLVVTPMVLLGALVSPVWTLAAMALDGMMALLAPLAAWPMAVWHAPAAPWPLGLLAVAGGVLSVCPWPAAWRAVGVALIAPALLHQPARPREGVFEVLAPDVGQGSAVLVRTARHALLYDAGAAYRQGGDAGESILLPWLRRRGERLDRLLVSHEDNDHAGGAASVAAAFPQAQRMTPGGGHGGGQGSGHGGALRWPAPVSDCVAGQRWRWDGVDFAVLHPLPTPAHAGDEVQKLATPTAALSTAAVSTAADQRRNARSCVLLVDNGHQRALLTGDIGRDQEVVLAARHPALRLDLLMAPHHGSRSSSSPVALNVWRPRVVLIQAGHLNRFGHPAPEVTARYDARGARWFASPACGEAVWRSHAPEAVSCWRQTHRRYWHWQPNEALWEPSMDEHMNERDFFQAADPDNPGTAPRTRTE